MPDTLWDGSQQTHFQEVRKLPTFLVKEVERNCQAVQLGSWVEKGVLLCNRGTHRSPDRILLGRPEHSLNWLRLGIESTEYLSSKEVFWKSPKLPETPFFLPRKIKCCVSSYRKVGSLLPRSQPAVVALLSVQPESKLLSKNYLIRILILSFFFADYFIILFKSLLHWLC